MILNGIDVSAYQGKINWQMVRKDQYYFAGIKATEGNYFEDPQFKRNWIRSKVRGVRRIAYHFFHADISGKQQCEYFHNTVHSSGGLNTGDCAMLDIETTNGVDSSALIKNAEEFVTLFLATTKCGIYIYTGAWFWDGVLASPQSVILGRCPLWISAYGPNPGTISNWPSGASMWQWTSSLNVPGIVGNVDGDKFLGTVAQYNTLAEFGGRD